ncbi:hypothetical protein EJB05_04983, partial [Eragrostis curvula]
MQSADMPISGDAVDMQGHPLWPWLKPISLSCRSMTGRSPSLPPPRNHHPAPRRQPRLSSGTSPSEDVVALPWRLPTTESAMATSPSRRPPWAPPRRHPRRRRLPKFQGTTIHAPPPPHPLPGRQLTHKMHQQSHKSDSELAPEKIRKSSCHDHSGSTSSTTPTKSSTHGQPESPNTGSYNSNNRVKRRKFGASEGLSQEEAAEGQMGSDSSSCSSPLREPLAPLVPIWTSKTGKVYTGLTKDRAALDMYHQAHHKYLKKQACQARLPTLRSSRTVTCIKECYSPMQKEIFLNAAKSVLSLSAYCDGVEINRCSGVLIELDPVKESATILTSASLICIERPFDEWTDKNTLLRPSLGSAAPSPRHRRADEDLGQDQLLPLSIIYAVLCPRIHIAPLLVTVHLLDGTIADCELLYFSKQYDIAFYAIFGESPVQALSLESNLEDGKDLYVLARNKNMDLICKTVQVKYVDPCEYQHNHYMFIDGSIPKCGTGGILLNSSGRIVGMLFDTAPLTAFIQSSLILRCLGLLRKFGRLPRPQLGLKLGTVGFLDIAQIELLSRNYGVASGIIILEVSAGCAFESVGIRTGDVILSCQGANISNVTQLEEVLLDIGEKHFENGNGVTSKVDIEFCVFRVRKGTRRVISFTVELSDGVEVFHS